MCVGLNMRVNKGTDHNSRPTTTAPCVLSVIACRYHAVGDCGHADVQIERCAAVNHRAICKSA